MPAHRGLEELKDTAQLPHGELTPIQHQEQTHPGLVPQDGKVFQEEGRVCEGGD